MVTIEQAIQIALEYNPSYNSYCEYKDGYLFWNRDDSGKDDIGMVVLKEDGKLISQANFDYDYIIPNKDFEHKEEVRFR